jgi:transcriptional regulator with XRE-family HTH domain
MSGDLYDTLQRHGLTAASLAHACGVSMTTIRLWRSGKRRPSSEHAKEAERKLGIPKSALRPDLREEPADTRKVRSRAFAAAAKKRGRRDVQAGIPDFLIWHLGGDFAIELKVDDNDLSDGQEDFMRVLLGVRCRVCWTRDQVFNTVREWGLARAAVTA